MLKNSNYHSEATFNISNLPIYFVNTLLIRKDLFDLLALC